MSVKGNVIRFGDNINTDIISPPQYMELGIEDSARYAMSTVDPDFYQKVKDQQIIVAGNNFGSGSSRETSPLTLKYLGTKAIVAKFFARIFYRNAINVGLLVVECHEADRINEKDQIEIDFKEGIIKNLTQNEQYKCTKIPPHLERLIDEGGLVAHLKKQFQN